MKKVIIILSFICILLTMAGCSDIVSDLESLKNDEDKFSHEITASYSGDYGIGYYIEGTVKNETDNDYSYVQIEFICYDNDGNNVGTALDNTNNLLGGQTWKFKAIFLGTSGNAINHCDYHEMTSW